MSSAGEHLGKSPADAEWFCTTHWSVVVTAGDSTSAQADEALERLCQTYWFPLYAFIRRKGVSPEDAEDLAQAFFARFLEKKYFRLARRARGKFRTFLLTSLKHFLANEWHRANAVKRGAGAAHLHFDAAEAEHRYLLEPAHELTAEKLYELSWAMSLLDRVRARVRQEYVADGRAERFEMAEQFLPGAESEPSYSEAARRFGVPEGTLKSDVHRLKQRYRELLRAEIANTVARPDDVADELRQLMRVLSG
jgi:DNA-directed RNA polymerase specialized sigma24 family protein